jgi:hypothetical protein
MTKKYLLVFILISIQTCFFLSAQNDTSKSHLPDSTNFEIISFHFFNDVDTLVDHPFDYHLPFFYSRYVSINPLSLYNGNAGSFSKALQADITLSHEYFELLPYHRHILKTDNPNAFIISERPATNAFYSSGKGKEQHFEIFHTQKIDSLLSITVNYSLINAPGLYANQRTNQGHFLGYLIYRSKNNRYTAAGGLSQNKIQQRENGGLANLRQFEDSVFYDRQFAQVNFYNAERNYRDFSAFANQFFRLTSEESRIPFVLGYTCSVHTGKNVFMDSDPVSSPYQQIFIDSARTYDSLYLFRFVNGLSLSNFSQLDSLKQRLQYRISYEFMKANVHQTYAKGKYSRNRISAALMYNLPGSYLLSTELNYFSGDVNHGNYRMYGKVQKQFHGNLLQDAGLEFSFSGISPQYIFQKYHSNHFYWDNHFLKQKQTSFSAFLRSKPGKIRVCYTLNDHYVFLNEFAIPEQSGEAFGVFHAEITNMLYLGKFYFETTLGTNQMKETAPVRFPEYYAQFRTGIEFPMFKNALKVFAGIESIWYSDFYADSWSLVTGMLYLQNDLKTGNYIYPGVFVGINIKRARIFVMMDNVTAGLMDLNYYALPAYPRYDRFFRWGLSWSFYN